MNSTGEIDIPSFRLDGRLALCTAASGGIGAAIAAAFAAAGADVAIAYFGPADEAEAVAAQAHQHGAKTWLIASDLGARGAAARLVQQARQETGRPLDILVACAARQIEKPWQEVTEDDADAHWGLNLRGNFSLIQSALPEMIERRSGRVITIGSVQERLPFPDMVIYAGLKSAQANIVKNLAKETAPFGVTINNIQPGAVATPRNRAWLEDPQALEEMRQRIPVRFVGLASDISGAAVYLASDAARYVTGADILVDGGISL